MAEWYNMLELLFFTAMLMYILIIAVRIAACVWVYRDARMRGMNAVLWLIIALVAGIIGIIIYTIVRKEHSLPGDSWKMPAMICIVMAAMVILSTVLPVLLVLFTLNDSASQGTGAAPSTRYRMDIKTGTPLSFNGETQEGQETTTKAALNQTNVSSVRVTLTWTDEANSNAFHENQPDTFKLKLTDPNGNKTESPEAKNDVSSKQGAITLAVNYSVDTITTTSGTGDWSIIVACVNAGDQTGKPAFIPTKADNGNAWSLKIEYSYAVAAPVTGNSTR